VNDAPAPTVSIVIPTRNRSKDLVQTLVSLFAQEYAEGRCEIVVVDDGSTDETPAVTKRLVPQAAAAQKTLRYLSSGGRGTNAAVNLGINASAGDVIVTMGDDTGTPPGWLSRLIDGLIRSQADAVSGPLRIPTQGPLLGKHREEIAACVTEVTAPCCLESGQIIPVAGNMAVWRHVFERGMFDETLVPPVEEVDWAVRASVRAAFVEDAWVWHCKGPESFRLQWVLRKSWKQGIETGCWAPQGLQYSFSKRLSMIAGSLHTSLRAFGHAGWQRCWGGVVVGLGELSRALALAGIIHRSRRLPGGS
jgi:GT2 family glycosyltransferase